MATKKGGETNLALMAQDINYIKTEVAEIKASLEAKYVTQMEFDPIRKVVYGMVSLILVGVIGALIGLVIIK